MAFASKAGCPLCGIVSSALHDPLISPSSPSSVRETNQPEILWRDDNFTVYREKAHPVSSSGHVIIAFKYVAALHAGYRQLTTTTVSTFPQYIPLYVMVRPTADTVLMSPSHPQIYPSW